MSSDENNRHGDTQESTTEEFQRKKKRARLKRVNITITVLEGADVDFGKTYILKNKKIRIGRDEANDIVLHDLKVSGHHCEIDVITGDGLGVDEMSITDLFSTNGTYLNGKVVERAILKFGDKIDVGSTILLFNASDEIEDKYQSTLFDIATVDSLTGLFNRRYILNELENQLKLACRYMRIFSVILVDIDHFKAVNDNYGHTAGDEYLKLVASHIVQALRAQDKAGRVGGEEFLILLPETGETGAEILANRIREAVESAVLEFKNNKIRATISAGVAQFDAKALDSDKIYETVDRALYRAKKEGKNRVTVTSLSRKKR